MKAKLLNIVLSTNCNNLQDFFEFNEMLQKMASRLDIKFQNVDTDGVEPPFQMFIKKINQT